MNWNLQETVNLTNITLSPPLFLHCAEGASSMTIKTFLATTWKRREFSFRVQIQGRRRSKFWCKVRIKKLKVKFTALNNWIHSRGFLCPWLLNLSKQQLGNEEGLCVNIHYWSLSLLRCKWIEVLELQEKQIFDL